jgi:4-alpha-glucanotransferase
MINSTKMLCCGEDLGMVPACVSGVMNRLNILGLRIQRMPGDPKVDFWHPADYPYLTVCTPAVHDTSTLR